MSHTRGKRSGLTDEDTSLWDYVTRDVHPMRRVSPQVVAVSLETSPTQPETAAPAVTVQPQRPDKRRWQPLVTTPVPRPPAPKPADHLDRKQAKKVAKGQVAIDGRIDLHGLTESEAHHRLRGYLRQAQAQGKRIILVITGKGREDDDPQAPFDFGRGPSRRGILKRNVPRWLAEPEMAALVVSFGPAHMRHGGDGALYIHLRKG